MEDVVLLDTLMDSLLIVHCEFINIRGIPIFVDLVDNIRVPRNLQLDKYLSIYMDVLNTADGP